eukprot:14162417-Heterocapsa_arctica.AAC.1
MMCVLACRIISAPSSSIIFSPFVHPARMPIESAEYTLLTSGCSGPLLSERLTLSLVLPSPPELDAL